MDKCEALELKGPYKFEGENSIFDEISDVINGVYLWCIKNRDNTYRVFYVGEGVDVKKRMRTHRKNMLCGNYSGYCLDSLKNNIKVLKHRPEVGMIPRFKQLDRKTFNEEFAENLHLFYAPLPIVGNKDEDKWLRYRYESGIVMHIENQGQNIISVGKINYWKGEKKQILITSGDSKIESLSNEKVEI